MSQVVDPWPCATNKKRRAGAGIADSSYVTAVGSNTVTLSNNATQSITAGTISFYLRPLLPFAVLNAYTLLASASLVQNRWQELWLTVGMPNYIAHFATLYLRSEGTCDSTPGAAAAAGLKVGVQIGASAGPVSQTLAITPGLDDYGMWGITVYGQILAQFSKTIGMGPQLII